MTINTNYQQESYISNGTLLDYDFDFPAFEDTDLRVYVKDTSDNVVLQTLNSDYTVAFNDDKTGTITFDTAPTLNYTIYIRRDTAQTQSTAYKTSSGFQALVVENDFDKCIAISQEIAETIDRQLYTSPFSDVTVNAELPIPVDTKCLKWEYDSGADEYSLVNSTYDPDEQTADATAQAVIATTQAGIATTQAGLSSGYATQSAGYRDEAEDFKDEAEAAAASINGDPLWSIYKTFTKGGLTTDIVSDIPYKYYNLTGNNGTTAPHLDATNWALYSDKDRVKQDGSNATFSALSASAKEYISNCSMPNYSSSVSKAMNTDHTAPSDGVIWGNIDTTSNGQNDSITINSVTMYTSTFGLYSDVSIPFNYKVKKGQVYQHYNSEGAGHGTINFAPMYATY